MTCFLHTSDWQLGMTREFLAGEAQERFAAARLDAIGRIAELARTTGAAFVVVAGDVFESNQVRRQTLGRALEKLRAFEVPVYLLPGNHDPLQAGSVYRTAHFAAEKPPGVVVLEAGQVHSVPRCEGVEVLGAPWSSKHPEGDLCTRALREAPDPGGRLRVLVGHGGVDRMNPAADDPRSIRLEDLEAALAAGTVHYVALGDRHSTTPVGSSGRVWYSGAPEPTDFDEVEPGQVLEVRLTAGGPPEVIRHPVATWSFEDWREELDGAALLDALERRFGEVRDKDRVVLRVALRGSLALDEMARLEELLARQGEVFAALQRWKRHEHLALRSDALDPRALGLSGFALEAWERIAARIGGEDEEAAEAARDALVLFHRLATEDAR